MKLRVEELENKNTGDKSKDDTQDRKWKTSIGVGMENTT